MKRSPVSASSSSSSPSSSSSSSSFSSSPSYSSSSSSSFLDSDISKSKRIKKIRKKQKDECQITTDANNNINATSGRRSSIYKGVTRHRWTGRFEAHLWDKSSWNNIQNKKGRQVYLGAYDNEEASAHTYDLAALKYWGPNTTLNFPIETYSKELEEMQKMSKEEYLASLRRRSSGFSRGVSKYRGVARHHHNGRWEARIGRVLGNKYLYLGTYNTQEEAAAAYDMAAIEYRGANAVTNFDVGNYIERLKEKGINIEHILRPEQLTSNCSAVSEEVEIEQPLSPQPSSLQEEPQQQISSAMDPPGIDSCSLINIDPIEDDELNWGFCLDSGNTLLSVPDLPLDNACELPNLFDETGFEDNIDLIFDACCLGNDANTKFMSENTQCNIGEVGITGNMEDENGKERLSSSSNSPSCSTTTSESCN